MTRKSKTTYSYTLEECDIKAVKEWAKKKGLKMQDLCSILNISQVHLSRILHGTRGATPTVVNTMQRLGIKLKKPSKNHHKEKNG